MTIVHGKTDTVFGQKKPKHILILATGDHVKHMVIRPWMLTITAGFTALIVIGYLITATYFIFRDDLIDGSIIRNARLQQGYENQIAHLRAKLDRITSQQLMAQKLVDNKVSELIQRQDVLSSRHKQLSPILKRVGILKTELEPLSVPVPIISSSQKQAIEKASNSFLRLSKKPANAFGTISVSLKQLENEQINHIRRLANNTNRKTAKITQILEGAKLPSPHLSKTDLDNHIGGPFIPAQNADFNDLLRGLGQAIEQFDTVRDHLQKLPIKNPLVGAKISSQYGPRRDPFLNRNAFHAGMDFKAKTGTHIFPAAKGRIIFAGTKGGYGKIIEIDHGNSMTTRYAHLSRIDVKVGQYVLPDTIIGRVGSTGRSTGPHLHYEIRYHGKAVNPAKYLDTGHKLHPLINLS